MFTVEWFYCPDGIIPDSGLTELVDDNIYAPPWGLSTLVKEFSAATRIIQSSSKELSTLVADRV